MSSYGIPIAENIALWLSNVVLLVMVSIWRCWNVLVTTRQLWNDFYNKPVVSSRNGNKLLKALSVRWQTALQLACWIPFVVVRLWIDTMKGEYVGHDWLISSLFLLFLGNTERVWKFLLNLSHLLVSCYLWIPHLHSSVRQSGFTTKALTNETIPFSGSPSC